jgi:ABC-2 type transport system permease protein
MTALRAEWTKLRTLPGTIWLVAGLVVLTAGVSVATMAATGDTVADPAKSSLIGVTLGQALVAILAVLAVGGEYSTQMMHTTLAAMPRRPVLLAAKAAVVTAVVLLAAAVAVRDSATAIGVVLGVLYVLPIVAGAVSDPHWQRHLLQVAPMTAGLAIQATTGLDGLPIGPWAGLGVVALWAAGALLAGGVIFMRRDA